jgi:DNA-directed RNA polymerase specialized sigma24 family protein
MASRSGDRVDLSAAGLEPRPVRKQSVPETSEDAMLVGAARDGDRAAFGHLYDRYARMVHGVLLAKVPVGEVDDLVQDVFARALRRLSTLRETGCFGAWLAAIARNLANDHHRRSVAEDQLTEDTPEQRYRPRKYRGSGSPSSSNPRRDQALARCLQGDIDSTACGGHERS